MRPNHTNFLLVVSTVFLFFTLCAHGETVESTVTGSKVTGSKVYTVNRQTVAADELPFGRLFTTPQQRQALDEARRTGGTIRPQVSGVDESSTAPTIINTPQPIKLLGVLLRADGKNKVWLSGGSNTFENTVNNRAIVGNISQSANVKVPLRGFNNAAILKPGQVWSPTKGRAEEAYQIPVPKPVVVEPIAVEPVPKPIAEQSSAAASSSAQTSSVSSSEVHSSVQSSAK